MVMMWFYGDFAIFCPVECWFCGVFWTHSSRSVNCCRTDFGRRVGALGVVLRKIVHCVESGPVGYVSWYWGCVLLGMSSLRQTKPFPQVELCPRLVNSPIVAAIDARVLSTNSWFYRGYTFVLLCGFSEMLLSCLLSGFTEI